MTPVSPIWFKGEWAEPRRARPASPAMGSNCAGYEQVAKCTRHIGVAFRVHPQLASAKLDQLGAVGPDCGARSEKISRVPLAGRPSDLVGYRWVTETFRWTSDPP